ncbi:MAG: PD-(D/E)XK nuclease family protein [Cytophagaceae bacterium]|nr:PD-(D/E)XK nuclease family protein [Cytophagaceae bacterium]
MTFLEQTARHIFDRHSLDQLSRVGVVLPSRRSVFFFKQELTRLADRPFLAPDVWAIEDFVFEMAGLQPVDPVGLLFEFYDVYREIDPGIQFERFTGWAPTLLSDFDRVDQYMAPPRAVFEWVSEAKALERWKLESVQPGSAVERYFRLFANMFPAYETLHKRLSAKGLAYRGMAYRYLAEHVQELVLLPQKHDFYYFAGFNALSESEKKIITYLIGKNRAEALWDTDAYYMDYHKGMEAGHLLREYKYDEQLRFGNPKAWKWQSDELLRGKKDIKIIGVPNASMQPKVAGEIYRAWSQELKVKSEKLKVESEELKVESEELTEKSNSELFTFHSSLSTTTAIVLGDENLLMPTLFSLDETVKEFNVTMGVSLRNSMLFTLIDAWFDAQRNLVEIRTKSGEVKRIPKFSHRHVLRLLNHPFIRRYEASLKYEAEAPESGREEDGPATGKKSPIRAALRTIALEGRVFLDSDELIELGGGHELFDILFTRWNDRPGLALRQCYRLIDLLRGVYLHKDDALETEYLYLFFTLLKRLESLLEERRAELVGLRAFRTLLYDLIRQTSIPFSGEPVSSLQIMGMLETRALDFERVIIMSVNEGNLPSGKRVNSLIPYDACTEFGLPTHSQQDAVTSYHFFRLLQRAKEIVLIHTQPTGEGQRAEKSRFLLQIEHELARANPNIRLTYPVVEFRSSERAEKTDTDSRIWKTAAMQEFLLRDMSERGLYPSHLNQYVKCSMQYYFSRVARLREEADEVEGQLGSDQFGDWIHKTLEAIDRHLTTDSPYVTREAIAQIRDEVPQWLETTFGLAFPFMPFGEGTAHVQYLIARKVLTDFYSYQLEHEAFPLKIIGLEQNLTADVLLPIHGELVSVKVAGRLDRLDLTPDGTLRVIDYKTGKVFEKELKLKPDLLEIELLSEVGYEKLRQLWLYKFLITNRLTKDNWVFNEQSFGSQTPIIAGIYSFRNLKEGLLGQQTPFAFAPGETSDEFLAASERQLARFVTELLDPAKPFTRTDDRKACEYCGFARLCGR